MSYDSTRDAEQLRMIDRSIDDFIDRYNNSDGLPDGTRQTVIFFPGGLASTLKRAKKPYVNSIPTGQMFDYDKVWLTFASFLGGAHHLGLQKMGGDEYRDEDSRIVIADGAVKFLGWTFYDDFTDWCEAKGLDYFVFGWDWRRKLQHSGTFFINKFLPHFQDRVMDGCNNADPLVNFSLIGHSAGGMVVNWILRKSAKPILSTLRFAITVATPFYGYSGQVHRWFEGESYLNFFNKKKMIEVICSLPACYAWQFLDEKTFRDNKADFAKIPYPLSDYPSLDEQTKGIADPYRPWRKGSQTRYPGNTGFDAVELKEAGRLVRYLASDLPPLLAPKFFNIRGDTQANDTVGSITWDFVPPSDPTPITDVSSVPGDGVQPAWSARHLGLAQSHSGNVVTVKGSTVEHMTTMNSAKTLGELGVVLGV